MNTYAHLTLGFALSLLAALSFNHSVLAQAAPEGTDGTRILDADQWNPEALYEPGAFLAEDLVGAPVYGPEGEEIGVVENLMVDRDEKLVGMIAEVGGFWDMGDTHVAVPWSQTSFYRDGVQTPLREDNLDTYDLYGDLSFITKEELQRPVQVTDDVATGPRTWKITSLLDDYASTPNGIGYGYVDDVIFSSEAEVQAVLIQVRGASYAYPFWGYQRGWHPGYNTYVIPFEEGQVEEAPLLDRERFRRETER